MESYQQGETVIEEAYNYNENNLPIDPDTIVITIKDITGTIAENSSDVSIDELDMTRKVLGEHFFNFDLKDDAPIGLWKVIVKATLDGIDSIRNDSFRVVL